MMEIPKQIMDSNGDICTVVSVNVLCPNKNVEGIKLENFNRAYSEYVDPKDLEIQRLLKIIEGFESPKERQMRPRLTKEEKEEVRVLVEAGHSIKDVAKEYGCTNSAIYKWRKDLHWKIPGGKDETNG